MRTLFIAAALTVLASAATAQPIDCKETLFGCDPLAANIDPLKNVNGKGDMFSAQSSDTTAPDDGRDRGHAPGFKS